MFPIMVIALGIVVLALGKRLAVLGAAVGALLGVGLLRLFNVPLTDLLLSLLIPGLLAVIGFFVAGFAKGIVSIVLLVMGALGARRLSWPSSISFRSVPACSTGSSRSWAASSA